MSTNLTNFTQTLLNETWGQMSTTVAKHIKFWVSVGIILSFLMIAISVFIILFGNRTFGIGMMVAGLIGTICNTWHFTRVQKVIDQTFKKIKLEEII
ncbi:MAG: hypothetical protein LBV67_10325 [Streptococcaceae bacterium]|jgi:hypothetical protein|nr:hypothetical protein [Streptococcaceae bacterium]